MLLIYFQWMFFCSVFSCGHQILCKLKGGHHTNFNLMISRLKGGKRADGWRTFSWNVFWTVSRTECLESGRNRGVEGWKWQAKAMGGWGVGGGGGGGHQKSELLRASEGGWRQMRRAASEVSSSVMGFLCALPVFCFHSLFPYCTPKLEDVSIKCVDWTSEPWRVLYLHWEINAPGLSAVSRFYVLGAATWKYQHLQQDGWLGLRLLLHRKGEASGCHTHRVSRGEPATGKDAQSCSHVQLPRAELRRGRGLSAAQRVLATVPLLREGAQGCGEASELGAGGLLQLHQHRAFRLLPVPRRDQSDQQLGSGLPLQTSTGGDAEQHASGGLLFHLFPPKLWCSNTGPGAGLAWERCLAHNGKCFSPHQPSSRGGPSYQRDHQTALAKGQQSGFEWITTHFYTSCMIYSHWDYLSSQVWRCIERLHSCFHFVILGSRHWRSPLVWEMLCLLCRLLPSWLTDWRIVQSSEIYTVRLPVAWPFTSSWIRGPFRKISRSRNSGIQWVASDKPTWQTQKAVRAFIKRWNVNRKLKVTANL